ncbi:MAG: ATP-binding protein [Sphingomonadales bacterium]
MADKASLRTLLERIALALEGLAAQSHADASQTPEFETADSYVWQADTATLKPVRHVHAVPLDLLLGIDQQKATLSENTRRFAAGYPANNALLWGARGTGKSSLVKAIHAALPSPKPALVEIHREDITSLPALMEILSGLERRTLLYCDDLSFSKDESSYKSLKAVLDGGLMGRPDNVIFYATSNRRHLMPRDMMENERSTAINPAEAVEEAVSLSDRFGLWLGFHRVDQALFLKMVHGYAKRFDLPSEGLEDAAKTWSVTRGTRSGRVAWQFIQDWAGAHAQRLEF